MALTNKKEQVCKEHPPKKIVRKVKGNSTKKLTIFPGVTAEIFEPLDGKKVVGHHKFVLRIVGPQRLIKFGLDHKPDLAEMRMHWRSVVPAKKKG